MSEITRRKKKGFFLTGWLNGNWSTHAWNLSEGHWSARPPAGACVHTCTYGHMYIQEHACVCSPSSTHTGVYTDVHMPVFACARTCTRLTTRGLTDHRGPFRSNVRACHSANNLPSQAVTMLTWETLPTAESGAGLEEHERRVRGPRVRGGEHVPWSSGRRALEGSTFCRGRTLSRAGARCRAGRGLHEHLCPTSTPGCQRCRACRIRSDSAREGHTALPIRHRPVSRFHTPTQTGQCSQCLPPAAASVVRDG